MSNDSIGNYKVMNQINKGAYAQVYEGVELKSSTKVALKIVGF